MRPQLIVVLPPFFYDLTGLGYIQKPVFVQTFILKKGDKVAIVSPSSGAAAAFPWVYHQGLKRLKEDFGLEPIEFPKALKDGQYLAENPHARARDINQALNDTSVKAFIATIGGDDQIKILDYLDKDVIAQNPKMFSGLFGQYKSSPLFVEFRYCYLLWWQCHAAMFRACSATSLFSLLFYASRALRREASETLIPTNFDFHLY